MNAPLLLDDRVADADVGERLQTYRRKRRFSLTPEPAGGAWQDARSSRFVVQRHHARHRHFDLRLQVGSVLRSWAVPRGPSRDPAVKRLAVEVEDHPLEYANFEGEIPQGEYGGGHVAIWDRGFWQADGDPVQSLQRGHLGFTLYGERLRGHWWLQRTLPAGRGKTRQWLLIKSRDGSAVAEDVADDVPLPANPRAPATAVRTVLPDHAALQLAVRATTPTLGRHWLHELKYDGYRLMMQRDGDAVGLRSRNGLDWTPRLPHLAAAVRELPCDSAVLDGELVVVDAAGRSDFGRLQQAMARDASTGDTVCVVFDLLWLDGRDLRQQSLTQRRKTLARLLAGARTPLRFAEALVGHGTKAYEAACSAGFEGIVSKDRRAPYAAGRSGYWRKLTCARSDEFVVIGRTAGRAVHRRIGALLLATPGADGNWRYVGRVGSGLDDASQQLLLDTLSTVRTPPALSNPDMLPADADGTVWTQPACVVEVRYRGITDDGLLRQPSYKGLRPDKSTSDLQAPVMPRKRASDDTTRRAFVALTHPHKTVFKTPRLTKSDVADYYATVARRMLPQLRGRPIALLRCPDGVGKDCFFQRHLTAGFGEAVRESGQGRERVLHIDDLDGLLALVQMGTVEIHAGQTTVANPAMADRMVFDIDPGRGVAWERIVAAAHTIRERLLSVRLQSFVRTSGGKGLHVVVPLNPAVPVATARSFAQALARTLAAEHPDEFVAVAGEARRRQRIFIDYLRNSRGGWAVASYSLRARSGAPVATPLRWRELSSVGASDRYDAASVRRRLARLQRDPWQGYGELRQSLPDGRG